VTNEPRGSLVTVISVLVISVAVTGYFVGLQSPMNPNPVVEKNGRLEANRDQQVKSSQIGQDRNVILSTQYADMGAAIREPTLKWKTTLNELTATSKPLAEISITVDDKVSALAERGRNRAFNGAPPTIPHPIDEMSAASCMACHGTGFNSKTLRISQVSHQFLTNCTQCHVENFDQDPDTLSSAENTFVGLPAPTGGPRAFDGAPPMIPHSTWMRFNCTSCHGVNGPFGIRTTHPWRQNCQQCHAPSSELDQVPLNLKPDFLEPPLIAR
jgi:cytochrome c-type protein NapB